MPLLDSVDSILRTECKPASMLRSFVVGEPEIVNYPKTTITNSSSRVLCSRFFQNMEIPVGIPENLFPYYDTIHQSDNYHLKMCDYIIFYESPHHINRLFVFLFELKTRNIGNAKHQIRAGYSFAKFIIEAAKRVNGYSREVIHFRGMVFSKRDVYRYPQRPQDAFSRELDDLEIGEHQSGIPFALESILPRIRTFN